MQKEQKTHANHAKLTTINNHRTRLLHQSTSAVDILVNQFIHPLIQQYPGVVPNESTDRFEVRW